MIVRTLALAAVIALGGCAGVPIGHHTTLIVGVGVVRTQKVGDASAVRARVLGAALGCGQITIGWLSEFCAVLPGQGGDVAILEQGSTPGKHLIVGKLQQEKTK